MAIAAVLVLAGAVAAARFRPRPSEPDAAARAEIVARSTPADREEEKARAVLLPVREESESFRPTRPSDSPLDLPAALLPREESLTPAQAEDALSAALSDARAALGEMPSDEMQALDRPALVNEQRYRVMRAFGRVVPNLDDKQRAERAAALQHELDALAPPTSAAP